MQSDIETIIIEALDAGARIDSNRPDVIRSVREAAASIMEVFAVQESYVGPFEEGEYVALTGWGWGPLGMAYEVVQIIAKDHASPRWYFAHGGRFHFIEMTDDREGNFSVTRGN